MRQTSKSNRGASGDDFPTRFAVLEMDTARWKVGMERGGAIGTYLYGIAQKSVSRFESLLRDLLRRYLELSGVDYQVTLREAEGGGKPLDMLTMGQVVKCFEVSRKTIIRYCHSRPDFSDQDMQGLLKRDELELLKQATKLRKMLAHHEGKFARNEETLLKNTKQLVDAIQKALGSPLLRLGARL